MFETSCCFGNDGHLSTGYFRFFNDGILWGMGWACDNCASKQNGVKA